MKRNTLFSFLTVAALGLLTAGPANADSTWNGLGSDWDTAANWSGGVPGSGDVATIPAVFASGTNEPVISTANAICGQLLIASTHSVTVASKELELDGAVTHDFDGDLKLSNATAIVRFTADSTVDGDGNIIGEDDAAQLRIDGGDTLTNEMVIKGNLTVKKTAGTIGTATFVNGYTGTVWANASGILLMDGSLTLDDDVVEGDRALWKATDGSSTFLWFGSGLTFVDSDPELEGDFVLCGDANIDFDVQVRTGGCFDETTANGVLDLAGNQYFCDTDTSCGGDAECYNSGTNTFNGEC